MKKCILFLVLLIVYQTVSTAPMAQWRGPNRDGVFPGAGLFKTWPEAGPDLLWSLEDLDTGYSSVSVTGERVYVTGCDDSNDYLTALDMQGNRLWRVVYGGAAERSYRDTRCTPTVDGGHIYLISGQGEVTCLNESDGSTVWSVPSKEKFKGLDFRWEVAESPLLADEKVIHTPGDC